MVEVINAYKTVVGKFKGRRPSGRIRLIYKDNIQMNVKGNRV
jgi:hypothetical protein